MKYPHLSDGQDASSCRFLSMCQMAGTEKCQSCRHLLRARPAQSASYTPPAANAGPFTHPAAIVPQEAAGTPARQARTACGPHVWSRPAGNATHTAPLPGEIRDMQIALIRRRLEASAPKIADARALSAQMSQQGDTSRALHWDVQARSYALEMALLERALTCWQDSECPTSRRGAAASHPGYDHRKQMHSRRRAPDQCRPAAEAAGTTTAE
jgi:hypothetical protein